MPDRDGAYLSAGGASGGGGGGEEGGLGPGAEGRGGSASGSSGFMGGGGALGNGNSCGGGGPGSAAAAGGAVPPDGVCRDFLRNVCKRGRRCRFRHPDFNEVPDLGVQKNEFVFCHDHQNKECVRSSCRFVHGSKEDEDYYKKSGELPLRLRGKVAAGLGLSPTDLPHSRGEVPICRDFLKGECQRGSKCKFRHVEKDYEFEFEPTRPGAGGAMGPGAGGMANAGGGGGVGGGGGGGACVSMAGLVGGGGGGGVNMMGMGCPSLGGCRDPGMSGGVGGVGGAGMGGGCLSMGPSGQRRYDRGGPCSVYDPLLFESGLFEPGPLEVPVDHTALQLKRRRLEGLRLADAGGGAHHYELGVPAALQPRHLDYMFLEEENALLRKRVEELKKQVSNLLATNEVLLDQNAQFRSQAKVMALSSAGPAPPEQSLAPPVGAVSSYNHGIAQTHTTLSSAGLQPRPVTQQDLVASVAGVPAAAPLPGNAAPPSAPPPHLNPEIITPLSAALVAQTIAQGMAPPVVSMAPVAVSVAPVVVSMAQPLPGITMSHATTPMVSYPIASQSMRITTLPH